MTKGRALMLFARVPIPGQVKTRLASAVSLEDAARLYEAFLQDLVARFRRPEFDLRVYLAPDVAIMPPDLFPNDVQVHLQRGDDLGTRMLRAFVETFAAGYEHVVIIGSDHPTLPSEFVQQAFDALDEPFQIVIGPATDGGYYLLGMNELYPFLFQEMAYSHARVFAETLERAGRSDAGLTILPPWYDVDAPAALMQLMRDLEDDPGLAPRTSEVVRALGQKYPHIAPASGPGKG